MRHFPALLIVLWFSPAVFAQPAPKVVTPAVAAKSIDQKVILQMEVKSTGGNSNRYLNSTSDYKDPNTFTIYIPEAVVPKFKQTPVGDPALYYKGKTIQVTGTVTLYKEKPQITIDEPTQIKVVPAPR
jgi:DNA/RNA endonuclease YhcR with UshA esterase domain